jgi:hypothetical protein
LCAAHIIEEQYRSICDGVFQVQSASHPGPIDIIPVGIGAGEVSAIAGRTGASQQASFSDLLQVADPDLKLAVKACAPAVAVALLSESVKS